MEVRKSKAADEQDAQVAALQWDKLQRAQQVAGARVSPFRVTLPTRGRLHSFSQILLTETRKPMTVQFQAASTGNGHSWRNALLLGLCGLALWWASVWLARATGKAIEN